MNTIELAVKNMEVLSEALEKASMNPKHYNSDFSYYLEQMSWSLFKDAQELKYRSNISGENMSAICQEPQYELYG